MLSKVMPCDSYHKIGQTLGKDTEEMNDGNHCVQTGLLSLFQALYKYFQMISNKLVSDTMYLCLGNGGDLVNTSSASQAGLIAFGK